LKVKSKPITFDEFVELVVPRVGDLKTKEGLRTVFSHLDTDNDDYINYDELKHLAKISGDLIKDD
jgi:Ca2+-binding EF-hand superfamily protein